MGLELTNIQLSWCSMEFHEQIKTLREGKGMTQQQAAEAIEIAKTTYIGYEKGEREPKLGELKKMAVLFGMTLSELCMDADSRNIDGNLVLMFEAVRQFNDEERKTFADIVEAMVIKHHANKAQKMVEIRE